MREQLVPLGTGIEELTLPGTLEAAAAEREEAEKTIAIEGVTWQPAPEYAGDAAGRYVFTAVLPEGCVPAEGVCLPQITVTVTEPETEEAEEPETEEPEEPEDAELEEAEKPETEIVEDAEEPQDAEPMLLSAAETHRHAMSVSCEQDAGVQETFVPLAQTSGHIEAGNYYLAEDMTVGDVPLYAKGTVNLCLNGHTLSGKVIVGVGFDSVLSICDCAGGGLIVDYSPVLIQGIGDSTLNLYGGTIRSSFSTLSQVNSAAVNMRENTALNVYGGKIDGVNAKAIDIMGDVDINIYDGELRGDYQGIAMYSSGRGTLTITGGTIYGGEKHAIASTDTIQVTASNCRIYSNGAAGIDCQGTVDIGDGADISGKNAGIYGHGATININGNCKISGGDYGINSSTSYSGSTPGVLNIAGSPTISSENNANISLGKDCRITLKSPLVNTDVWTVYASAPTSAAPTVITEGYPAYMSGVAPTEHLDSFRFYKVILHNGEAALTPYVLTFDANGGNVSTQTADLNGLGKILKTKIPTPDREGYEFTGWFTEAEGGEQIDHTTVFQGDTTVYAHWYTDACRVTFDYQGATDGADEQEREIASGDAYGELPAPVKTGYVFLGWNTQADGGGSYVTAQTTVEAAEQTLYACWKDVTPPDAPVLADGVTLPAGWTHTQRTIPLVLHDGEGVTELWVSADNGEYKCVDDFVGGSTEYDYTVTEGKHTWKFLAKDAAGNESAESAVFTVWLDTGKPVIGALTCENQAAVKSGWVIGKTDMTIHVPVADAGSGAAEISFVMTPADAGGNPDGVIVTETAAVINSEAEITFLREFRGSIVISCTDRAGNDADSVIVDAAQGANGVLVEDKAPAVTVLADRNVSDMNASQPDGVPISAADYYETPPALLVTVTDDTAGAVSSGISSVTWRAGDGGENAVSVGGNGLQSKVSFTIPASELSTGVTQIRICAADNAGNISSEKMLTVRVKGPEKQPAAEINYRAETLTGLSPGAYEVTAGGIVRELEAEDDGIAIEEEWLGTDIAIAKKGNGNETTDSPAQSLHIPLRPDAPDAPEPGSRTDDSVTLKVIADAEYRIADESWRQETEFGGLKEKTIYVFRAYYPATDTSFASEESDAVQIATMPSPPAKEKLAVSYAQETLAPTGGVEAYRDAALTQPAAAGSAEEYMGKTVYIRYPAEGIIPESLATAVPIPERPQKPMPDSTDATYPGAQDGTITGLAQDAVCEIRKQDADGAWGEWKVATADGEGVITGLAAGKYEVRVKAVEGVCFRSREAAVAVGERQVVKEATPDAAIDYRTEILTGLVPGAGYIIAETAEDGSTKTERITADKEGVAGIAGEWFGTAVSIVKCGNGRDRLDSEAQSLYIPERPGTPEPEAQDETEADKNDGKLKNLNAGTAYQISVDNGAKWQDVITDGNGEITGLGAGSYIVRISATDISFASRPSSLPAVIKADTAQTEIYTVTLQSGIGYILTAEAGSESPVEKGGSYTFRVTVTDGYCKTESFAVRVNDRKAELTAEGSYTVTDIRENLTVTVEGVGRAPDESTPGNENAPGNGNLPGNENPPGENGNAPGNGNLPGENGNTPGNGNLPGENGNAPGNGNLPGENGNAPGNGNPPSENGNAGADNPEENRSAALPGLPGFPGVPGRQPGGSVPENGGEDGAKPESAKGAVIVTVVCEEQEYTADVTDVAAVAAVVLTPEQAALVEGGETIEIRIDVTDISDQVPPQDEKVIADGIEASKKELPGLVLGMYVDISMFIKIGAGDWNAITTTKEPIDIVIEIPEKLQKSGREYYIIRAHEGEYTVMDDCDEEDGTITIRTDMFSSYAIAYQEADGAGQRCSLCHLCPTFLGICYFVWLALIAAVILIVLMLIRRRREEQKRA